MDFLGIGFSELLILLINLLLVGGWFILAILALLQLRRQDLPETARAIWAASVLLVPIGGAIAFWIVRPGRQFPGGREGHEAEIQG